MRCDWCEADCCVWQPADNALVKASPKEAWVSSKAVDSLSYSYDAQNTPYPGIAYYSAPLPLTRPLLSSLLILIT